MGKNEAEKSDRKKNRKKKQNTQERKGKKGEKGKREKTIREDKRYAGKTKEEKEIQKDKKESVLSLYVCKYMYIHTYINRPVIDLHPPFHHIRRAWAEAAADGAAVAELDRSSKCGLHKSHISHSIGHTYAHAHTPTFFFWLNYGADIGILTEQVRVCSRGKKGRTPTITDLQQGSWDTDEF